MSKSIYNNIGNSDVGKSLYLIDIQATAKSTIDPSDIINLISENEKYTLKDLEFPSIQHWCDEGIISWYQLAIEIRRITKEKNFIKNPCKIKPISSNDYKFIANRPKYSVLDCTETEKLLKIKRIYWKTSLFSILNTIFSK